MNSGNLLLRGVPGVGKTFFGVILAAISDAKFARIQGRADLQPTEVVGFQMINPSTGQLVTEFGPLASAVIEPSTLIVPPELAMTVMFPPVPDPATPSPLPLFAWPWPTACRVTSFAVIVPPLIARTSMSPATRLSLLLVPFTTGKSILSV